MMLQATPLLCASCRCSEAPHRSCSRQSCESPTISVLPAMPCAQPSRWIYTFCHEVMMTTGLPTAVAENVSFGEETQPQQLLERPLSECTAGEAAQFPSTVQVVIEIDVRRARNFIDPEASGQRRRRSSSRRAAAQVPRVADPPPSVLSLPEQSDCPAVPPVEDQSATDAPEHAAVEPSGPTSEAVQDPPSPVRRVRSQQRSRAGGDLQQRRLESVIPRHVLNVMQGCDKPRPRMKAQLANGMQLSPRPRRPPVEPLSRSVPLLPTVEVLQALLLMENHVGEEFLRGTESVNKAVAFNRDMKSAIHESRERRSAAIARVNERTAAAHSRNMRQLKASTFQEAD
mmetsp:Transcript_127984/g.292416  ORF Transcript_127984/g.292416 Transcript_127984/m.292416 type:complete len:343 (+) Transcript_127984:248-1276(+)